MKNYRLIYSNFPSKIISIGYLVRSLWITLFALLSFVIYSFESNTGASIVIHKEGLVIFILFLILFFLNYIGLYSDKNYARFLWAAFYMFTSVLILHSYSNWFSNSLNWTVFSIKLYLFGTLVLVLLTDNEKSGSIF